MFSENQEKKVQNEQVQPYELENINIDSGKTINVKRFFSKDDVNPFDEIEWIISRIKIKNINGDILFDQDIEHPVFWDEMAVRTCAEKYMKSDLGNLPHNGERSVKDVIHRVSFSISKRGKDLGYLDEKGSKILYDELCWLLLHQFAAFNSPVFFNWGLYDVYGFKGNSKTKRWAIKNRDGEVYQQQFEYENAQGAACFITEVEDELINGENGIYDWVNTVMSIYANGSGSGTNVSKLRGDGEPITGGGKSSGLLSWLKIADSSGGAIKSGGKTRRAASIIILNDDHPDLLEFIDWKKEEEYKARILILNGFLQNWSNEKGAYKSISAQNSNNSILVTDKFINAVINDEEWELKYVLDKKVKTRQKARDIFDKIVESAWECGDPGLLFKDKINEWNTIPNTGEIIGCNPCSEIFSVQNSACVLASLNLIKFLQDDKNFWIDGFKSAIETFILSLEIVVAGSSYPTKKIAETVKSTRPLGLGYCNMGGLIMTLGYPYDSDQARSIISCITSLQTSISYKQSSKIASVIGSFSEFKKNKQEMLKIIKKHQEYNLELKPKFKFVKNIHNVAIEMWEDVFNSISKYGCRNSQVVVIPPTGTVSFLMGTTNNGIEPPFSLISTKLMSDGSRVSLICQESYNALRELGYSNKQIEEISKYLIKNGNLEDCFLINTQHIAVFDTANIHGSGKRYIRPFAHIDAVAAATPFISGGISKTINLPNHATKEDVYNCYIEAWKRGCKGITVYRDGSKWSQPLNTSTLKNKDLIKEECNRTKDRIKKSDFDDDKIHEYYRGLLKRKKACSRAPAERINFNVNGENIHYIAVRYKDNGLSELWMEVGKENPTINGLADTIGRVISIAIQYGVPIEALVETLEGLQFNPSGWLGENDLDIKNIKSISDLTAKVLMKLNNQYSEGLYQENIIEKKNDKNIIEENELISFSGIKCENCGSKRTTGTIKCGICLDCGTSYGSCG